MNDVSNCMRIVICDDDSMFVKQLHGYLCEYFQEIEVSCPEISCFYDSEALLSDMGEKDIVFLDIEMNGIDGIYAGSELKKLNPNSIIFIITSFVEYLDDAMRFHVFRYLFKPLDKQRLFKNLKDAVSIYMTSTVKFAIETKESIHTIPASEIVLVEAHGRTVTVHTIYSSYKSVNNMQYWVDTLHEKCFYQTHRSFIVNMEYVSDFDHTLVRLCHNRFQAYLTRRKYNGFRETYLLYLESTRK